MIKAFLTFFNNFKMSWYFYIGIEFNKPRENTNKQKHKEKSNKI